MYIHSSSNPLEEWESIQFGIWDITCADTFATSYVSLASTGAGQVANQAEQSKRQIKKVQRSGSKVLHICPNCSVDYWGLWGGSYAILSCNGAPDDILKSTNPKSFQYLCQKISECIQRFNSSAILYVVYRWV